MGRFIDLERMQDTTDVTEYVHSLARYYLCSEQGIYSIMNYLELDDIDLTKTLQIDAESRLYTNPE